MARNPLCINPALDRPVFDPVLSSILLAMSDLVYCKGNHLEPEMCYCEEYSAPTNVPIGQRELCTECLHRKSKHPRPQQPAPVAEPLVPPALPVNPGGPKPSKPAAATPKERAGVTAIYKQSLARRAGQGPELKFEVSTDSRKTVAATRSEVMSGFYPTIKRKVTVSKIAYRLLPPAYSAFI